MTESKDELRTFDVFAVRPTTAYLVGWQAHIEATGYPETFTNVSTSVPVDADNLTLLSNDLRVPITRREDGQKVPCPICSPRSPKFQIGRMAWFPEEKTVRFIGHRCAKTHFGETYVAAERRFDMETRIRGYINRWHQLQLIREQLAAFFGPVALVAKSLHDCRQKLDEDGNDFCALLRSYLLRTNGVISEMQVTGERDARGNEVAVNVELARISGLGFIADKFDLASPLPIIRAALKDLQNSLPQWEEAAADANVEAEILRRGEPVSKLPRMLLELAEKAADAQRFLDQRNFRALEQHHQRLGLGRLKMSFEGKQLVLQAESFQGGHYARPFLFDARTKMPAVPKALREIASQ